MRLWRAFYEIETEIDIAKIGIGFIIEFTRIVLKF